MLNAGKVRQFMRNLQTPGAFIAAFTSEKQWMIPPLALDNGFFRSAFVNPQTM
jgi:hypothetical protein